MATGLSEAKLNHREVEEAATRIGSVFIPLLKKIVKQVGKK